MSWNPFSEDGTRMIAVWGHGYALYRAIGEQRYQWAGWVPEFSYGEQWLADGDVRGEIIEVPDAPQIVKGKRGAAA